MVAALTHIDDLEWYNRTLYFDKKLIWMLRKVMERLFKSVREQQCLLKRCGFSGLLWMEMNAISGVTMCVFYVPVCLTLGSITFSAFTWPCSLMNETGTAVHLRHAQIVP